MKLLPDAVSICLREEALTTLQGPGRHQINLKFCHPSDLSPIRTSSTPNTTPPRVNFRQKANEATMAPPNNQKRVKGKQVYRPFVYGTIAKPFDDETNPKPAGTPADHTHSWTVFVKGVDDADITYWCKKVQFKLHESIPNPLRSTFRFLDLYLFV